MSRDKREFRIYNTDTGKMSYSSGLTIEGSSVIAMPGQTVMEKLYLLRDESGKDLYEEDIVECVVECDIGCKHTFIGCITYEPHSASYFVETTVGVSFLLGMIEPMDRSLRADVPSRLQCKVIGNCCEHEDLWDSYVDRVATT